jgi:6,7-dimethyl-8-ribityllumazine synthase
MAGLKGLGAKPDCNGEIELAVSEMLLLAYAKPFSLGTGLRIAIIHARWNAVIVDSLVAGAKRRLLSAGLAEENIVVQSVPGSYELPSAVQQSASP